ncbi:hypothetical protein M422DRAFT_72488 [Sphaerobolus stellatus SS14]|uniref:Nuclear pore complex NUP2/50/61 domain-containing protein n=1 Tax=Sphaerobolus stellatus (strain SS14) TaxID=990650 RepID=A0A0C9UEH2_SPHS4|nr:hypothetical protein M422DRAFT_72488 [Sphaerobolus stellatus SS14]
MKRPAEKQITKDNSDREEIQDEDNEGGFKKADDASLAQRKIRSLPRRSRAMTVVSPETNHSDASTSQACIGFKEGAGVGISNTSRDIEASQLLEFTFVPCQEKKEASDRLSAELLGTRLATDIEMTEGLNEDGFIKESASLGAVASICSRALEELNESFADAVMKVGKAGSLFDVSSLFDQYNARRSDIIQEYNRLKTIHASHATQSSSAFSFKGYIPKASFPPGKPEILKMDFNFSGDSSGTKLFAFGTDSRSGGIGDKSRAIVVRPHSYVNQSVLAVEKTTGRMIERPNK